MPETFYEELSAWSIETVAARIASAREADALKALERAAQGAPLTAAHFLALLSPAAAPRLESMARLAQAAATRVFGRAVQLFTPLYLSNYCVNACVYCGFNAGHAISRNRLTLEQIEAEGAAVAATGLRHILLLTGDARAKAGPEYIAEAARRLRRFFPGIGVEVYALAAEEYALLRDAGVDSFTMFQETYNEALYAELHPSGPKRDFRFRLAAPERAAEAGLRGLNLGALLGLDFWPRDAFFTGLHAAWLQRRFPDREIAVSVPRIRPQTGGFAPAHPVSDRDLVQIILALRLFLPTAGIVVSTRERAALRDRLVGLGVTKISAGVSTAVGGRCGRKTPGQFEIADSRSVDQVAQALRARGFQPVFKHWEPLEGGAYACGATARP